MDASAPLDAARSDRGSEGDTATTPACTAGMLYASDQRLIDTFVTDDGVLVVQPDAIVLVGRDGQTRTTLMAPRPITAAAFDGQTLVIADAAVLTAYSPQLVPKSYVLVVRSCAQIALMDSQVVACRSGASMGTVYDTYDVGSGVLIAQGSTPFQFGSGMLRIPGLDDFMTWDTNVYLYQVVPDSSDVVFVDGSPNTGAFIGNGVFAFSTPQPTDLLNWKGQRFTVLGNGCTPVSPYLQKELCFTPDGQLDTLPVIDTQGNRAHYIALANGQPGQLFGLVSESPDLETRAFLTSPCAPTGCTLQKIDYTHGMAMGQARLDIAPKTALVMRADPACDMAVLAYQVAGSLPPSASEWTGFRVDLIDYHAIPRPDGGVDGSRGDGGAKDAAPADAATTDGPPRLSTGCAANGLLDTGISPVINAFPTTDGIIVVRAASIALIKRDGTVKTMVSAPAPITAAGFTGQRLVTGDSANVRVYSSALAPLGSTALVDPCWESVMTPGGIFVCEPDRQHLLTFATFDVNAIQPLKRSNIQFLAGGQLMQSAAGTPYVVLLSGGSPSTYGLYSVANDGTVNAVQETASYIEPTQNSVFQFAGTPPLDLLTSIGVLLRLTGPGCGATDGAASSGCLAPDGNLGTLFSGQRFVALDSDGAGNLFGLVSGDGSSDTFDTAPCVDGCALQKLDVPQRAVTAQQVHVSNATKILFMRQDPTCNMAAVGYQAPPLPADPSHYVYNVDLLDYLPSP